MKTKYFSAAVFSVFIASILLISCNSKTKNDINDLPPERVQALTTQAYIFSYPLIMNYATMYKQAINPNATEYVGGFGKFRHYGFASSDNKDIVSPNNDTPYSWAWVDLRSEPWVLLMPPADGNRYYTSQWDDLWGFVLDSPGSILDGQEGGAYMIAPTNWKGSTPEGIKRVIYSESFFAGTLTRTGADGSQDFAQMQAIQDGYSLIPLHKYTNQTAPKAAKNINWIPFNSDETTIDAFKYVNFTLPFTIPNAMDQAVLDSMALLGIGAGLIWDTTKFTEATKEAIKAGIAEAMKQLEIYGTTAVSGKLFNTRAVLKTDYIARTYGVIAGIFGNYATQASYLSWQADADGNPINTANATYKVTFKKSEIPKSKYFWSITMYSLPERFLVANPLNRYSIGSRSPQLKTNADGSIDIYFSKNSPGKALESNWLPAPNGIPFLILRVYGPEKSILEGTYQLPPIVKVK